jgi:hypothetical protein
MVEAGAVRWDKKFSHMHPNALAGQFPANAAGRLERSNAVLVNAFHISKESNGKIEAGGVDQLFKMFQGEMGA